MFSILALLAVGLGMSLILPDGSGDGTVSQESDPEFTDENLELNDGTDLLAQIDLPSINSVFRDDEPSISTLDEEDPEVISIDQDDGSTGDVDNNLVGTSNVPYEVDLDLSSFENVEFASNADSEIIGTDYEDLLVGGSGSDLVDGGLGDDFIFGGTGSDTLSGGGGHDLIVACANPFVGDEADFSVLDGGEGDDTLIGENDDRLIGGDGIDSFQVFSENESRGSVACISDFDVSSESILIEIRNGQLGDDMEFYLQKSETGVEVLVDGMPVVFLEGVEQTTGLNIVVRSVGY